MSNVPASLVILTVSILFSVGCGGKQEKPPPPTDNDSLNEIAEVYKLLAYEKLSPPAKLKDLETYIDSLQSAWPKLEKGDIVLRFGVPLAKSGPAAKSVLAYLKDVPSSGGSVLLRDGSVQEMTAAQFQAAPK